jgi:RNA polymerase sigma factor (sigma-70 family)
LSSTPLEEDAAWVTAFRRGERAALERVFRAYAGEVARSVRATRVSEHEVESLVHDIFVRAFAEKARLSFDGLRPFGAWLQTIGRNVLIDRARRERRMESRAPEDMPVLVDSRPDAATVQDARELQSALTAFVDELDTDERRLFAVRFEEQQALPAAARAMGWSEIRVRKVDTRLRTALLAALRHSGLLGNARVRIGTSLFARRKS